MHDRHMDVVWLEKLEAFLEGEITRADLERVAKLTGVDNIDQEINWFQNSQLAIETSGVRNQLEGLFSDAEHVPEKKRAVSFVRPLLALAAIGLVVVLGYWVSSLNYEPQLYSKYLYVDPGMPILMSQSDEYHLNDAMTYYSEENYAVAIEKLGKLLPAQPTNDTIQYFLGASYLYENHIDQAIDELTIVSQDSNSIFKAKAEWLLVMTALRRDDMDKVHELLDPILSHVDHPYIDQAMLLSQELSNAK